MGEHVRLPCHRSIQKILKLCLEPDKDPQEVQSKSVIQKQIELERKSRNRPSRNDINPVTFEPTKHASSRTVAARAAKRRNCKHEKQTFTGFLGFVGKVDLRNCFY